MRKQKTSKPNNKFGDGTKPKEVIMLSVDEEAKLVRELRRMRDMLQMCNETAHSGTDAEIKANYVDWKSRTGNSPYYGESVASMRCRSYARQAGAGKAAISMGLEYVEKMLLIIKNSDREDDDND